MNRGFHAAGVLVALLLHSGLVAIVGVKEGWGGSSDEDSSRFEDAKTIEAALAFKAVEKKSRQPQKQKKKKFKPRTDPGISRDAEKVPEKEKEEEKLKPKPDEIDIESILEKNRLQNEDLSSTGVEEVPKEGSATGSEWGTERDAHGDPYVGELKGRLHKAWQFPSLETGGGRTEGCVRLDADGRIVDREVRKKSPNANLNRSVYLALKDATDMDKPVPSHLTWLTEQGICFIFEP